MSIKSAHDQIRPCDTEDRSNDAENSEINYIWKHLKREVSLNCDTEITVIKRIVQPKK